MPSCFCYFSYFVVLIDCYLSVVHLLGKSMPTIIYQNDYRSEGESNQQNKGHGQGRLGPTTACYTGCQFQIFVNNDKAHSNMYIFQKFGFLRHNYFNCITKWRKQPTLSNYFYHTLFNFTCLSTTLQCLFHRFSLIQLTRKFAHAFSPGDNVIKIEWPLPKIQEPEEQIHKKYWSAKILKEILC